MEKTLKEYEQSQSTHLQAARSQAAGFQSDLEQATCQIEELTAQLAKSKQDADIAVRDLQNQLSEASSSGAAQNESLAELQTNLQSEIATLKKDVFSKTRALDAHEAKITASGAKTVEELISTKAMLEASNTEATSQIAKFIEDISKLQDQLANNEATEVEWEQMATEIKQECDALQSQNVQLQGKLEDLVVEKDLVDSQLKIAVERVASLEATIIKEKETASQLWGKGQDTRKKHMELQKELQDAKETLSETQLQRIDLQQTIRNLQERDRQAMDEIAGMKLTNKKAISDLEKELAQVQATKADLEDDSKRAFNFVQQCQAKMAPLAPFAATITADLMSPTFTIPVAHLFLMLLRSVSDGGLTWKKGMRPCVGEAVGREDWCCNREEVDADVQERFRAVGWTQAGSWRGQRVHAFEVPCEMIDWLLSCF